MFSSEISKFLGSALCSGGIKTTEIVSLRYIVLIDCLCAFRAFMHYVLPPASGTAGLFSIEPVSKSLEALFAGETYCAAEYRGVLKINRTCISRNI